MHITKSTLADMRYVLANLSKEFRRELELGGFSLDQLRISMKAFIKAEECLTLWANENIIGMLGFQVQHSAVVTAFPSTPDFFKQDTARFGRRLMRKIQADMGNLPVVSESYSENERVERWYRAMGYRLDGSEGNKKVFRLDPAHPTRTTSI
ncbi:hypothetical protein [Brucella pseudogrignonensis]|uniref:hypothetical protein n=1 Tax=Brucella pseudogrignonensis TaxID=419475 RepID=UPI0038D00D00